MLTFLRRILGAMALDARTYEEIEADRAAGTQALLVVMLSAGAGAFAARSLGARTTELPTLFVLGLMTWAGWAALTCQIGTQLLPTKDTRSDVGELLRTIGFASAPGILAALAIIPSLSRGVVAVTTVWMIGAMVVAVRQALDFSSTWRALAVCIVGLGLSVLLMMLFGSLMAPVLSGRA